jgi:hypothetical protein
MRRFLILPLLLMLCACGSSHAIGLSSVAYPAALPVSATEPVGAVPHLVERLRADGALVEPAGSANLAFLSAEGQMFAVDGERIQVYEYADPDAAAADAARFSPDGGQISTDAGVLLVNWVATPHLYRADRLLVIYVGDDAGTQARLDRVVGSRFAGGANPYQVASNTVVAETR